MPKYKPEDYEVELDAQLKLFRATGLKEGDAVRNTFTGDTGYLYFSGLGFACVRTKGPSRIWDTDWVADSGKIS